MFDCIVFEHLGQLSPIHDDVLDAAAQAGSMVGFRFLKPVPNLNINSLRQLVENDLHLPEMVYTSLATMIVNTANPSDQIQKLEKYEVPFYVLGDPAWEAPTRWWLHDTACKGFVRDISEVPFPLSKTLVVRDTPGAYPLEVNVFDNTNLENLFSMLNRRC